MTESNDILSNYNKGINLTEKGKFNDAIKLCERILKKEPENIGALCTKSFILFKLGKIKQGKLFYEQAVIHFPNFVKDFSINQERLDKIAIFN